MKKLVFVKKKKEGGCFNKLWNETNVGQLVSVTEVLFDCWKLSQNW